MFVFITNSFWCLSDTFPSWRTFSTLEKASEVISASSCTHPVLPLVHQACHVQVLQCTAIEDGTTNKDILQTLNCPHHFPELHTMKPSHLVLYQFSGFFFFFHTLSRSKFKVLLTNDGISMATGSIVFLSVACTNGASYNQWHLWFEEAGLILQYLVWKFSKRSWFPASSDHLRALLNKCK